MPDAVPMDNLIMNNKMFTIDDVEAWVLKHECIMGRFSFFETWMRNNDFYQRIVKPLLSTRSCGSIDVERAVKPMKHNILTKKRNRLGDAKGIVLFRASQNLQHLQKMKMVMKMKIH